MHTRSITTFLNTDFCSLNWSNPLITSNLVSSYLEDLLPLDKLGSAIRLGSWNGEYLWQKKAEYFIDSYRQITARHHVLALQETSAKAAIALASLWHASYVVSSPNLRGQALAFIIHPRLQVLSSREYMELTKILEVPNLRPALQIELKDKISGFRFFLINVHLKSLLGQPLFTSLVRQEQLKRLVELTAEIMPPP